MFSQIFLYIRSFIFNLLFFPWTAFCVLGAVFGFIFGQKFTVMWAYFWGPGTHFLLRVICGVTYEIQGKENWKGEAAIFASKHQSALETSMIQKLVFNSAIILKKELAYIPIFGQVILKAGVIPIDRSKGKKVLPQLVNGATKFLNAGRSLFIFPEGRRRPLEEPTVLRPGIGVLYEKTGFPVYPIALNTGAVWGRRSFLKKPGKVIYRILPPIQPGLDKSTFLKTLTDILEKNTEELRQLSRTC